MLLPSISNTTIKCLPITFNFVNTDKRKKAKACEKIFTSYMARFKKFVDYETTNKFQLCIFYKKAFLV